MDRNQWIKAQYPGCRVALRKESVDRNSFGANADSVTKWSLSARRAWIEISCNGRRYDFGRVALRKESVDRNVTRGQLPTPEPPSLSARRAWIEIPALLSNDQNAGSRSPQGERG